MKPITIKLAENEAKFKIEQIEGFYYAFVKLNGVWVMIENYAIQDGKIISIGGACSTINRAKELIELAKKSPKIIANYGSTKDFLEKEVKAFLCNYDKEFDDDAPAYDIAEHFYQLGKNSQKPVKWSEEDEEIEL